MNPAPLLDRLLDDEGLTGDLDEPEAGTLVSALADRVRAIAANAKDVQAARRMVDELCRRGRQVAAVVAAVRDQGPVAVRELADRHGLPWPTDATRPATLLAGLLKALD